jgi:carboxylesterase type B
VPSLNLAEANGKQYLSKRSYWVNFAATGDPNGAGLPAWPSFSQKNMMCFDQAPSFRPIPNLEKSQVIDGYYAWRREHAREQAGAGR